MCTRMHRLAWTCLAIGLSAVGCTALEGQLAQTYRHPLGFTAQLPQGWRTQETEEGILFIPGDLATDAMGQPLELFMLGAEDAEGIFDPADPAVVAYFQQGLPGFRPVGKPEPVQTLLGPGAVLTFEGSAGGPPLRQRTYVALYEGLGIYLAHLSTVDLASRRDQVARQIFKSFSWGEAEIDASVVGGWYRESSNVSEGSGYSSSSTTRQYVLRGDGSVAYTWQSSISVDVEGLSSSDISDPETWAGRYAAGGGLIYMYFDNGEEMQFRYEIVQDSSGAPVLKLTNGEGGVEYYSFLGR